MSSSNNTPVEVLKSILKRLHAGESADQVREEFAATFDGIDAASIAQAERQLILEEGVSVDEIRNLCDVHASVVQNQVIAPDGKTELGHPLMIFEEENKGLDAFLHGKYAVDKAAYVASRSGETFLHTLKTLYKVDRHYSRKENLMFPYLERNGVTAPPKVMWAVDDEIRQLIKDAIAQVEQGEYNAEHFTAMEEKIKSMITKENNILKPMLVDNLTPEDWTVVAQESPQIGFAFAEHIAGASPSDAKAWARGEEITESAEAKAWDSSKEINLPSGYFAGKELQAMLDTLPCDLTFVNAEGNVQYFSEGKIRVFPRTRTIIGRKVEDCHPPKSLHVVEELIESFKNGEKDEESFWIQRGGMFVLIRYYAVRDAEGTYLGVLEVTEEISGLRSLEGQKTLLAGRE